jgi:hypothetical protein
MSVRILSDAPPFIILTFSAAMIGVITAMMTYLQNRQLLNRNLLDNYPRFTIFHYLSVTILFYLTVQFLVLIKIILNVCWLDAIILFILLGGNVVIVTFLWLTYQYRVREVMVSPVKD